MTPTDYEALANPELRALIDVLDELELDGVEAELSSGILNLEFPDGAKYVVNSHRAALQIWMAAERTAWHFDWNADKRAWIAAKTGEELWSVLALTLSTKLGRAVVLTRPSSLS